MGTQITLSEVELERVCILEQVQKGLIRGREASEALGVSARQVRRLRQRFEQQGPEGIKRRPSGGNRSFSQAFKKEIMTSISNTYHDFGPTFAAEKLAEREGLRVNRETLRQWMMEAGLWKGRRRKNARIHQSRDRRACFGELVQIDGSHHDWFEGRAPKCCLYVFIDDATGRLISLHFEPTETLFGYFKALEYHLNTHGRPLAYYSDRHSIFLTSRPNSVSGHYERTQFHRALNDLAINLICARSPQAKGRVERANKTLQDRLIKEMRLNNINTIQEANAYAIGFIEKHNGLFAVDAANPENAHRAIYHTQDQLRQIVCEKTERTLSKNLEISYKRMTYQVQHPGEGYRLRHAKVLVCERPDGEIIILHQEKSLSYKSLEKKCTSPLVADRRALEGVFSTLMHRAHNVLPTGPTTPAQIRY